MGTFPSSGQRVRISIHLLAMVGFQSGRRPPLWRRRCSPSRGRFAAGDKLRHGLWLSRPPAREPVLARNQGTPAVRLPASSRANAYGALVLDTGPRHVRGRDLPKTEIPGGRLAEELFGTAGAALPVRITYDSVVDAGRGVVGAIRLGLARVIARRRACACWPRTPCLTPDGAVQEQVFDALGADPLSGGLWRTQKCFPAPG